MNRVKLEELVNIWDPFDLIKIAPHGEYSDIVNEVDRLIENGIDKNTIYLRLVEYLQMQFCDIEYSDKKLKAFINSLENNS